MHIIVRFDSVLCHTIELGGNSYDGVEHFCRRHKVLQPAKSPPFLGFTSITKKSNALFENTSYNDTLLAGLFGQRLQRGVSTNVLYNPVSTSARMEKTMEELYSTTEVHNK